MQQSPIYLTSSNSEEDKSLKVKAYYKLIGLILYSLGQAIIIHEQGNKFIYVNKHDLNRIVAQQTNENKEDPKTKLKLPSTVNQLSLSILIYSNRQKIQYFSQINEVYIKRIGGIKSSIESLDKFQKDIKNFSELLKNPENLSLDICNKRINRLKDSIKENQECFNQLNAQYRIQFEEALNAQPLNINKLKKFNSLLNNLADVIDQYKKENEKYYASSIQEMDSCIRNFLAHPKVIESTELASIVNILKIEEKFPELNSAVLALYKSDDILIYLENLKKKVFNTYINGQADQILEQLKITNDVVNLCHHASENLKNSKESNTLSKKIQDYQDLTQEIATYMSHLAQLLSIAEIEQAISAGFSSDDLYRRAGHVLEKELKAKRLSKQSD